MVSRAASTDRDFFMERQQFWLSEYDKYKSSFAVSRNPRKMWQQQARWGRPYTGRDNTRTGS